MAEEKRADYLYLRDRNGQLTRVPSEKESEFLEAQNREPTEDELEKAKEQARRIFAKYFVETK